MLGRRLCWDGGDAKKVVMLGRRCYGSGDAGTRMAQVVCGMAAQENKTLTVERGWVGQLVLMAVLDEGDGGERFRNQQDKAFIVTVFLL